MQDQSGEGGAFVFLRDMAEFPHAFLKDSLLCIATGAAAEQPEKAGAVIPKGITASAFALKIKLLKHNKFEREFFWPTFSMNMEIAAL